MEWHIIGTLAFVVIYNLYRYYREQKDSEYCSVIETVSNLIWPWCHKYLNWKII